MPRFSSQKISRQVQKMDLLPGKTIEDAIHRDYANGFQVTAIGTLLRVLESLERIEGLLSGAALEKPKKTGAASSKKDRYDKSG